MANYYDILGISRLASQDEIKAAYKEKAKEYHPDRHGGDAYMEEIFKEINTAYQTLSNSYTRSNYDMLLRYGEQTAAQKIRTGSPVEHYRYRPPVYRKPRFSSRENLVATGYAFLFAFAIAAIIKTGLYFIEEHRAAELAKILSERREFFDKAVNKKQEGNLVASLNLMEDMGRFYIEESDMRDFKEDLVYDIRDKADDYLEQGEFEQAIEYYNVLSDYSVSTTINYLLKMAKAHQGLGQYKRTLEIYQMVRLYGYTSSGFYFEVGTLYEDLGQYEQALNHYELCVEKAAEEYEVTIGRAYPVVINAQMIPVQHYKYFLKVSEMHLQLRQYEEAIKSVAWSGEIWSDSLRLYEIRALSYRSLGRTREMNQTIRAARKLDPDFSLLFEN